MTFPVTQTRSRTQEVDNDQADSDNDRADSDPPAIPGKEEDKPKKAKAKKSAAKRPGAAALKDFASGSAGSPVPPSAPIKPVKDKVSKQDKVGKQGKGGRESKQGKDETEVDFALSLGGYGEDSSDSPESSDSSSSSSSESDKAPTRSGKAKRSKRFGGELKKRKAKEYLASLLQDYDTVSMRVRCTTFNNTRNGHEARRLAQVVDALLNDGLHKTLGVEIAVRALMGILHADMCQDAYLIETFEWKPPKMLVHRNDLRRHMKEAGSFKKLDKKKSKGATSDGERGGDRR